MDRRCSSKDCSGCGRRRPKTHFARNTRDASGLQPWCRSCHRRYLSKKPKVLAPTVHDKRCSTCQKIKSVRYFNKDISKPSGVRSQCNACRSEQRHAQRHADRRRLHRSEESRGAQKPNQKKRKRQANAPDDSARGKETSVVPPTESTVASRQRDLRAEVQRSDVAKTPATMRHCFCSLSPSEMRLAALLTVADYESTKSVCL